MSKRVTEDLIPTGQRQRGPGGGPVRVKTYPDNTIKLTVGHLTRSLSPPEAHAIGRILVMHAEDAGVDPETWEYNGPDV